MSIENIKEKLDAESNMEEREWIIAKAYLDDEIEMNDTDALAQEFLDRDEF